MLTHCIKLYKVLRRSLLFEMLAANRGRSFGVCQDHADRGGLEVATEQKGIDFGKQSSVDLDMLTVWSLTACCGRYRAADLPEWLGVSPFRLHEGTLSFFGTGLSTVV